MHPVWRLQRPHSVVAHSTRKLLVHIAHPVYNTHHFRLAGTASHLFRPLPGPLSHTLVNRRLYGTSNPRAACACVIQ